MKSKCGIAVIVSLILFCLGTYAAPNPVTNENIIRLHVIANSDSEADQAVKLKVRDALLDSFFPYTEINKKEDAEQYLKLNLKKAEQIAHQILKENGFPYTARAEYGVYDFPLRTYGNLTLPAGKYYGLRIKLGKAEGKNWWCVMYPPLCFNESNTKINTKNNENITFEIKFKIAELWQYFK